MLFSLRAFRSLARPSAHNSPLQHQRVLASFSTSSQSYSFEAEAESLLDIVTNSLYRDKEVFLRELLSNAADALEKLRHQQVAGADVRDSQKALDIRLKLDNESKVITIEDSGIGMTQEELQENLGTIARSGSRAFLNEGEDSAANIIGKFGVGFYSVFAVASRVEVFSRPSVDSSAPSCLWESEGSGSYTLSELAMDDDRTQDLRGTRIVLHLKDEHHEFAEEARVRSVVNHFSNFIGFPILLGDEQLNTTEPLWVKDKKDVTDEQYTEMYRYLTGAFDEPMMQLHFRADAPIEIKTLLFVGQQHQERYGMGRMKPGVNLYSRKVLLESGAENVLPDWLRFVRGVVDSEDFPLSISRESLQDTTLLKRVNRVLTKRLLRTFADSAKKDEEKFVTFYNEYSGFLKEGICTDYENQADLAKLMRFESSMEAPGKLVSFDDYASRCTPDQRQIYYLSAPNRELALASPYYEIFKKEKREVLFLFQPIEPVDDFVFSNLGKYGDRELVPADSNKVDLGLTGEKDAEKDEEESSNDGTEKNDASHSDATREWLAQVLTEDVAEVKISDRLVDSPAIVVDFQSAALRRMMRMLASMPRLLRLFNPTSLNNNFLSLDHQDHQQKGSSSEQAIPKQILEISATHPIIIGLDKMRNTKPDVAEIAAKQLLTNALVNAGLVDDARTLNSQLNKTLELLVKSNSA